MDLVNVIIILIAWFALSLTGALVPGPLSAACVMQASKRGRLHGFLPMVGHAIVELGIVAGIIITLQSIEFTLTTEALILGFGGVVVVLFGLIALRDYRIRSREVTEETPNERDASTVLEATAQGAIVSILSPYFLIWWFAVGLASIQSLMLELQGEGLVIFLVGALVFLVHISTDFIFGAFLSIGTDTVVKRAKEGETNWMNVGIGIFQIALGIWFIGRAGLIIMNRPPI